MSSHRCLTLAGLALGLSFAPLSGAAPIASNDTYFPLEDTPFVAGAPGVMDNDNPNGATGVLSAAKVTDPAHGVLSLQQNGAFTYTPAANYFGPDAFTYKIVEGQGPITFTIDQPNSVLSVNVATVTHFAGGTSDNKTSTAQAKGSLTALLLPSQSPFATAQIRTLNLTLAQAVSMTLCVQRIFICTATLKADIAANGLTVTMREDQAGPAVPVTAGSFTQLGSLVDIVGTVALTGSGLAGLITVPPTADLNSTNQPFDFTGCTITQNGSTLVMTVPIDLTQSFSDPTQYDATVHVTGTIRATAPVPAAGPQSNVATVTLDVTAEDDAPVSGADRYYTRQNHTINVPVTGSAPVSETLIAAGSVWKYSTGADLGTGWRAVDFVDTAWASGAGVLGYDTDNPIATTIPARANVGAVASAANPNYPTAYFRKEFNVAVAGATLDARVEFQRDDAAIIYMNGTEVYRDSTAYTAGGTVPFAATGEIAYATYAGASMTPDSDGAVYKVVTIPANLFREGKNVIAAEVHQNTNVSSDLRWDLKCFRTAQPTESLVGTGSVWKYNTGSDLGAGWRSAEFNDTAWNSAAGPLGYDVDIPAASTITARANMAVAASAANPNYPTAYFRREFTLTNPFNTVVPRVEFQRDDACIIYVNGVEIYRDSTPYSGTTPPLPATGDVAYSYYAAAGAASGNILEADSLVYKSVTFSRSLLREGRNVIAAEVHQNSATSSDLRFDLRALRTTGVGGVTVNDTDVDGPAFNVAVLTPPAHGTLALNPDGSFAYTPAPAFPDSGVSGADSFVYRHRAFDGSSFSTTAILLPMGGDWKYLANGTAAPQDAGITAADWRHAAFIDAAWAVGGAELGYGDGDETTIVEDNATAGYVATDTDRYITTYFRRKFDYVGSTDLVSALKVRAIRDDGIVIFLNGTRIAKDNLPDTWDSTTPATVSISGAAETTPIEFLDIPASALRQGENILAVEIHQQSAASSDISFNMELSATSVAGARVDLIVLNDDLDSDNMSDTWERANGLDATVANGDQDADRDGQSNRNEFLAGTNPNLASSAFRSTGLTTAAGNQLQIAFQSVPGKLYHLQHSDALGSWLDTGADFPAHPSNAQTILQFNKPALPKKFYRVRVVGDWQ